MCNTKLRIAVFISTQKKVVRENVSCALSFRLLLRKIHLPPGGRLYSSILRTVGNDHVGYIGRSAHSYNRGRKLRLIKESPATETAYGENLATASETELSDGIVSQFGENVKTQFSLSEYAAEEKEAREAEKVKRAFEEAYRTDGKGVSGTRYSFDKYTEKQYNAFGWARDTDALTENEIDDMYTKIQIKGSLKKFPQSSNGEAIIEVDDKAKSTLQANNVMVFVRGTKSNPEITRVVKFNIYEEDFRKDIYASNTPRKIEAYARALGEELIRYYDRINSADFREYTNKAGAQRSRSESKSVAADNRNSGQ